MTQDIFNHFFILFTIVLNGYTLDLCHTASTMQDGASGIEGGQ